MLTRLLVCAAMAGARILELAWSREMLSRSGKAEQGDWTRRTYPGIVAVHTLAIAWTALRGYPRASPFWLALLFAVQPIRAWVLWQLGPRWNTLAAVPDDLEVETRGPYRWVRHPNYTIVAVELFALPMAFRLRVFALWVALANAVLLALRIREEEALLSRRPAWIAHFRDKPRFIPGLF